MDNLFSSNIDFFGSHALDSLSTVSNDKVIKNKYFRHENNYPCNTESLIDTNENPDVCINTMNYDESETFIPSVKEVRLLSHKNML